MSLLTEIRHALRVRAWLKGGGVERLDTSRLSSRKLWVIIGTQLLVTLLAVMDVDLDVIKSVVALAGIYLGAQGGVDIAAALKIKDAIAAELAKRNEQ